MTTRWERTKAAASVPRNCEHCGRALVRAQHGSWRESLEHFAERKYCNVQCRTSARYARLGMTAPEVRRGYGDGPKPEPDPGIESTWTPGAAPALKPGDWRLVVYGGAITAEAPHRPPRAAVRRALERQGNVCLYCQIPIGTEILRRSRVIKLRRNFDHFVPHAYVARNPDSNFVIACHICNLVKRGNMFTTVEEARKYVLTRREELGYEPAWSVLRRVNLDGAASRGVER